MAPGSGRAMLFRLHLWRVGPSRDQTRQFHHSQPKCTAPGRDRSERRNGQKNHKKCDIHWYFPPEIGGNPSFLPYSEVALWQLHSNSSRDLTVFYIGHDGHHGHPVARGDNQPSIRVELVSREPLQDTDMDGVPDVSAAAPLDPAVQWLVISDQGWFSWRRR